MRENRSIFPFLLYIKKSYLTVDIIRVFACFCFMFTLLACNDNNRSHPDPVQFTWNFHTNTGGWAGDFTGYPLGEEEAYELQFSHDSLPEPLDGTQHALRLSGRNNNSKLFMFVKKQVSGLQPNTIYYAKFTIEFASNEPGIYSGPLSGQGNGIYVAAGATMVEPLKMIEENHYALNIGKCNLNQDGDDMVVLGNYSNDTNDPVYALKTIVNQKPFHCITSEQGELWIIVGIDSGVQHTTTAYFNNIKVDLF